MFPYSKKYAKSLSWTFQQKEKKIRISDLAHEVEVKVKNILRLSHLYSNTLSSERSVNLKKQFWCFQISKVFHFGSILQKNVPNHWSWSSSLFVEKFRLAIWHTFWNMETLSEIKPPLQRKTIVMLKYVLIRIWYEIFTANILTPDFLNKFSTGA